MSDQNLPAKAIKLFSSPPRDPKRIKEILTRLEEVWQKYPDLRFCQLTESITYKYYENLFNLEDDKFLILLNEFDERHSRADS